MRKVLVVLVIVLLASGLAFAEGSTEGAILLIDFDLFEGSIKGSTEVSSVDIAGVINWFTWDDQGDGRKSEIAGSVTDDAYYGKQAIKVTYVMDSWCGHGWSNIDEDTSLWDWSAYKYLSFWVKGDGKRHEFQISISDIDEEEFRSPSIRVTNKEWKQVKIPISNLVAHDWQADHAKPNGKMDWPIIDIQIAPIAGKGELIFDLFELIP